MQLRVPKKYLPNSKRRSKNLLQRRSFWLFLGTLVVVGLGYVIMQDPATFQAGASNFAANVSNEIGTLRADAFPDEPTPTLDVRNDVVACENAYLVGDLEDVIAYCSAALRGRPNDVELHFRVAYTLVITSSFGENQARIDSAIEIAKETITANPESPLGWIALAMALDWNLKHSLALPYAQRALEIDPNNIMAKATLANIYRNVGRPELAKSLLDEALTDISNRGADNETRAQVWRNYGRYLISVEANYEQALEAYQTARQIMPSHSYITIEIARTYNALGQPQQQIELLENALLTAPRDVALLSTLALAYFSVGDTTQALDLYSRCLDVNPRYLACVSPMGWLQYQVNNDYEESRDLLRLATEELGSVDPYDWYLLGRSYTQLGQCQLAEEPLRRSYELFLEFDSPYIAPENYQTAFAACNLSMPIN